ncbi:hypothetical protein KA996_09815, partial [bacterium]|nr:hypothetical protein [bacterium]
MKVAILIFTLFLFSCTSCNGNNPKSDHDSQDSLDYDNTDADLSDDLSDEALAESEDTESEIPDIDEDTY